MAKCLRCGKKGLFLKLGNGNICNECSINIALENQKSELENLINQRRFELNNLDKIKQDAQNEARDNIKAELNQFEQQKQSIINSISDEASVLESKKEEEQILNKSIDSFNNKLNKIKSLYKSMQYATKKYIAQEEVYFDETLPLEVDEILSPTVELKLNCMNVKQLRSLYNQNNKLIKDVLKRYEGRYTTKANVAIYRLMVIALEAELQNVLYNIKFGVLDKAIDDIKSITEKFYKIATDGNQNIAPTIQKFIGEIEFLFIEAIKIEYEYHSQKERIKEEQRALREQMRQEAEERKQLEQQRKQVEKEEEKYKNEVINITSQLESTEDNKKIEQLQKRLAELTQQLSLVEEKKEEITKLQNGKAGYVYIISNLGSFGDKVFKIGMTRRLEPMDRIKELGDASVPFPFDVHSSIFSNDAVTLEHDMHMTLNNQRVNKVNLRKEFFNVSIDELEELVNTLEPTAEFNKTLLAEQYYQSCSITEVATELLEDFSDDE